MIISFISGFLGAYLGCIWYTELNKSETEKKEPIKKSTKKKSKVAKEEK